RSRNGSFGENMHNLTAFLSPRLRVHDDVRDLRPLAPDELLDPARVRMGGGKRVGTQPQREVGDEALVRVDEPQPRRIDAELGEKDAADGRRVAGDFGAGGLLAERLEMRLYRRPLGNRLLDRALDLLGDGVRLLQREVAGELEMEREL